MILTGNTGTVAREVKSAKIEIGEGLSIRSTEPEIAYCEFASKTGVSKEAVGAFFTSNVHCDYIAMTDILIGEEMMLQIGTRILMLAQAENYQ